ncbi:MAG: YybS family protein [Bacteriovoracaceae bacterium]|jgi:hypothetical protein|nr:YybS family protein [Bacteriovoracaceae bacterium]
MNQYPSANISNSKIIILGLTSIIMSLSLFMSAFAPFPLSLITSLKGRKSGYAIGGVLVLVTFVLSVVVLKNILGFAIFALAFLISILVSEINLNRVKPVKGIFFSGLALIFLFAGIGYSSLKSKNQTLDQFILSEIEKNKDVFEVQKKELEKAGSSKQAFEALSILNQPEVLKDMIIRQMPSYLIISSFVIIWLNLMLLFRSKRLFRIDIGATSFDLINIKLPDNLIWGVIVALVMALVGEKVDASLPLVGETLLKAFGVFYFFQGFGIYIQFLDYTRIRGFFRTFLVVFTTLTASYLLAGIGLFDMFFNFRKYFKNKE